MEAELGQLAEEPLKNSRPDDGPAPQVTAVISTHNRRLVLRATLDALSALACPLHVVVVDNASSDQTSDMLRADYPAVEVIPHSWNDPLTGYNLGFRAVRTPYVLVLDDDSAPRPGVIERMLECLAGDPRIAAAAGNVIGPNGASEWGPQRPAKRTLAAWNLIGCGFLARATALAQAAGYNVAFRLYYNDLDLALRILSFGHRIAFDPAWEFDHRRVPAPEGQREKKLLYMARNFARLARSHFSGVRKWDLLLGHAGILWRDLARKGLRREGLAWMFWGLVSSTGRRTRQVPPGPARHGFVAAYSLSKNLARIATRPQRPEAAPGRFPGHRLDSFRGADPCYWRTRLNRGDESALDDEPTARGRRAEDASRGCRCFEDLQRFRSPWADYQRHLLHVSFLCCAERRTRHEFVQRLPYRPFISVLLPVYRTSPDFLRECLLSVESQIYPFWELCAVEDGGGDEAVRELLREFGRRHPSRVRLAIRDENRGIARTTQEALDLASGEFVALLDHDDRLAPEALFEVARHLNLTPEADWLYSDNDKVAPDGARWFYHFKPDWSPDLLEAYNYVLHLSVMRRSLVLRTGGFRPDYDGAQDYDLYLRLAENTRRVLHIPRVLYSWRQAPGSVAGDLAAKPYAFDAGLRALDAAVRRRGADAAVERSDRSWDGNYRVTRRGVDPRVELLVLAPDPEAEATRAAWMGQAGAIRITASHAMKPGQSAGRALAETLAATRAPTLIVAARGVCPAGTATLESLVSGLAPDGVAALCPKVLASDGRVDHCGLALSTGGNVLFPLRGAPADDPGYGAYGAVRRNVAAVSPVAAVFKADALRAADACGDDGSAAAAVLDASLALRQAGFRLVADGACAVRAAPDAAPCLDPPLSASETQWLTRRRPSAFVGGDPFYNVNLREQPADFGVRDVVPVE